MLDARGDWADVEAALDAALSRCGAAAEARRDLGVPGPLDGDLAAVEGLTPLTGYDVLRGGEVRRIEIDLLTLRAGIGTLVIERLGAAGETEDIGVRLTARVGAGGNPGMEGCLVESIAWRLEALRGVETAPLNWPD